MASRVTAFILAGGKGTRLHPLTRDRAKPAVPFGGTYRIIDFTLSNCLNSSIRRVNILVQYKCISLERHIRLGWNILCPELGEYIVVIPAQQRVGERWYQGTADAVFQNIYTIEQEKPDLVLVLAGDHVYKMNYGRLIGFHEEHDADLTISAIEVPREHAKRLGVLQVDSTGRVVHFVEKPDDPPEIPGKPGVCLASMGIYVFSTGKLIERLREDSEKKSTHDFGRDIIPGMTPRDAVYACPFVDENRISDPEKPVYWRDIGTIDAYWEASMDLVSVNPIFNLYDRDWPIRTYQEQCPPAKTVFAQEFEGGRRGYALDSLVSGGCIISGGRVERSILSPFVRINSYSEVYESVLFENVEVGRYAKIRRAIIDKDSYIGPGVEIGYDLELDAKRFVVSEGGIVVVPKGTVVTRDDFTPPRKSPVPQFAP